MSKSKKALLLSLLCLLFFAIAGVPIFFITTNDTSKNEGEILFGKAEKEYYLSRLDFVTEEQITGNEDKMDIERINRKNQEIQGYKDYVDKCYMQYWTQEEMETHQNRLRGCLGWVQMLEPEQTAEVKLAHGLYRLKNQMSADLEFCEKFKSEYVQEIYGEDYLSQPNFPVTELKKMVNGIEALRYDLIDEKIAFAEAMKKTTEYENAIRMLRPEWLSTEWEEWKAAQNPAPAEQLITQTIPLSELFRSICYGLHPNGDNVLTDDPNTVLRYGGSYAFPIECKRTFPDNGNRVSPYGIFKLDEGGYLYTFFHRHNAGWATDWIFIVKKPLYQKDFEAVQAGTKLDVVKQIDEGFAILLGTGTPFTALRQSVHIVDGGFLVIDYEMAEGDWPTDYYEPSDYLKNVVVKSKKFVPNGEMVLDYSDHYGTEYSKAVKYKLLEQDFPDKLF